MHGSRAGARIILVCMGVQLYVHYYLMRKEVMLCFGTGMSMRGQITKPDVCVYSKRRDTNIRGTRLAAVLGLCEGEYVNSCHISPSYCSSGTEE